MEKKIPLLKSFFQKQLIEAGCDEAGRGCLAGPVFAAAVILPKTFKHALLNDSKKLNDTQRRYLRPIIEAKAITFGVAQVSAGEIDQINILNASFLAMHRAIDQLKVIPESLLIDGNRFTKYKDIPHHCIIEGDGKYMSIAAASILARYAFLKAFDELSEKAGFTLTKGAGSKVDQAAARLIKAKGMATLNEFTKLHFANTEKAKKLAGIR